MKTATCKYCSSVVQIITCQTIAGIIKAGDTFLAGHRTPNDKPCVLGSGTLTQDNEKELINKDLALQL